MRGIGSIMLGMLLVVATPALAQTPAPANRPVPFTLASPSFPDLGVIPDKYTQKAASPVSLPLSWINVPDGTQSFALIFHDPDVAPRKTSNGFVHWIAFNIPATVTALPEAVPAVPTLPDGTIQSNNSSGKPGFAGIGNHRSPHHMTAELYALDTKLSLGPDATPTQVITAMDGHVLGKAVLVGMF